MTWRDGLLIIGMTWPAWLFALRVVGPGRLWGRRKREVWGFEVAPVDKSRR